VSRKGRHALRHPALSRNALGLTVRDYEGALSTLCAGCGHDSITRAIVTAFWRLLARPERIVKLSGIGCSSKTPGYFLPGSHGFNSVHGRMPSIATGAIAANRDLTYIGVSDDGDSLSIGLGQLCHAIRRGIDLTYVLENNGVYALTKGQFSASADVGSRDKRGVVNRERPIDPVTLALSLGASFVARSFSGDKAQLVPLLQAALRHRGFALIDVISPCVSFNDHEGSTKSYRHTRARRRDMTEARIVEPRSPIEVEQREGEPVEVRLHDGGVLTLHRVEPGYDPTDRDAAYLHLRRSQEAGEIPTGLLFVERGSPDMHAIHETVSTPLVELSHDDLCPGAAALDTLMDELR